MILKGTKFQLKVWKYLKTIPKGKVKTYKQVAIGIKSPKSARAVANACAKNPYAPKIPCHRVIRSDGALGGYSGRGGISCYKGECWERGSARLHAQPGDHIYVHYKDYTLPKPYGIDGCTMSSSDFTVDTEPKKCDHIDIYNFAKVKESTLLSPVSLSKVSISPYPKPYVSELNDINDDIHTWERLVKLEENRIEELGFEPTKENMFEHSFKYEGLLLKIDEFYEERDEIKQKLKSFNSPKSSKTFVEGMPVYITGTFHSNVYSPNQFVFAYQAEHVETGHVEQVTLSAKTNITKKKSVDVEHEWTPRSSGEYILKLYVLDGSNMGAVLKDPVINNIHVEPAGNSLTAVSTSLKN